MKVLGGRSQQQEEEKEEKETCFSQKLVEVSFCLGS